MDVRRLAAVDMYGTSGTRRRRRIVLAEFAAGLAVMVPLGSWLTAGSPDTAYRIVGIWLIGAGLNYAPLLVYAVLLSRPGALEAELAGVDPARELRRYGAAQLSILIPLALAAAALLARFSR